MVSLELGEWPVADKLDGLQVIEAGHPESTGRQTSLPAVVTEKIRELIKRTEVQSVSCPYFDPLVWKVLVEEQVKRAKHSGLQPQDALFLSGPDGDLSGVPIQQWGGSCHIPSEGLCGGDLLVRPKWRQFKVANGAATGRLSTAASVEYCSYVLSPEDFGEVPFASREDVGEGWVLYVANVPTKSLKL